MAIFVYGMNLSLDGYVDHEAFAPGPDLFRHWIDNTKGLTGSLYGRVLYGLMRYWDDDQPDWGPDEQEFAQAWRAQHKWVASRSLRSVGPNATLIGEDIEAAIRALKAREVGQIDVGGPCLARSLGAWGLIDEYRLYLRPVVLGRGTPFFAGPLPHLRLLSEKRVGEDAICLTYVPD